MTASDMLCDHCGGLITSGTRKVSVDRSPQRKPGLQVAGEGEFAKTNVFIYHSQTGSDTHGTGKSCWQHANGQ